MRLVGRLGFRTEGVIAGHTGPDSISGPGDNIKQLCGLLETPNRYRALVDIDPAQMEARYTCCNKVRPNLGDSLTESIIVNRNSIARKQRDVTQLRIECPSVEGDYCQYHIRMQYILGGRGE